MVFQLQILSTKESVSTCGEVTKFDDCYNFNDKECLLIYLDLFKTLCFKGLEITKFLHLKPVKLELLRTQINTDVLPVDSVSHFWLVFLTQYAWYRMVGMSSFQSQHLFAELPVLVGCNENAIRP